MVRTCLGRRLAIGCVFGAVAIMLGLGGSARAQGLQPRVSVDNRWQAWLGCWTPGDFVTSIVHPGQRACVVPAPGTSAADIISIDGGRIFSRERIEVTGERRHIEADGCSGWQSAEWSPDGRRIYLTSEATCQNGVTRRSTGLFAISSRGDWLHVGGVSVGGNTGVGIVTQRPSIFVPLVPEITSDLQSIDRQSAAAARVAAAGLISVADIIEASRHMSAAVVEAWLAANGQAFNIDARHLVELADAGVPDRVIDMVVALSYPEAFAIGPSATSPGELVVENADRTETALDTANGVWLAACGPYGDSLSVYGWGPCSLYGSLSGYSLGPPGLAPYAGAPVRGWYAGRQPLVIIRTPGGTGQTSHGQVVSGRGYVAGSGGTSGAAETPGTATPKDASGTTSSGDSGASSSGSSSGGASGSGGERIAKPR